MASEPSEDPVSISLPPDLAEWVDQQAADRDTDRETVLVQLLAAHQATEELDDGADLDADVLARTTDLEDEVRDVIAGRLSDIAGAVAEQIDVERQVQAAFDERLADALDEELTDRLEETLPEVVEQQLSATLDERVADALDEALTDVLDERLDAATQSAADRATQEVQSDLQSVESDFMAKIEDVRDRVIQVKKETDGKAPADHEHPTLDDRLVELETETAAIEDEIEELRADVDERLDSRGDRLDDVDERVSDVQEKLRTVAYVVKDLREDSEVNEKRATSIEQIKRSAAEHDLERARCEACGEGVAIGLMTDPECPHCNATVTDVEPGDGFFGKPHLVKAHGIEAASEDEDA